MMHPCSIRVSIALALASMGQFSAQLASAEASGIGGTWRGTSTCTTDAPACHNESVVYYIKEVSNRPDLALIQADKIVDGKPVTMGTGEFQYDRARHTLEWRTPRQTWLLKVAGHRIEGTLTLADGTVFRTVTLEKHE